MEEIRQHLYTRADRGLNDGAEPRGFFRGALPTGNLGPKGTYEAIKAAGGSEVEAKTGDVMVMHAGNAEDERYDLPAAFFSGLALVPAAKSKWQRQEEQRSLMNINAASRGDVDDVCTDIFAAASVQQRCPDLPGATMKFLCAWAKITGYDDAGRPKLRHYRRDQFSYSNGLTYEVETKFIQATKQYGPGCLDDISQHAYNRFTMWYESSRFADEADAEYKGWPFQKNGTRKDAAVVINEDSSVDIPQAAMGWIPISRDYDVREEYAAEGDGSSSDEADDVQYAGAPGVQVRRTQARQKGKGLGDARKGGSAGGRGRTAQAGGRGRGRATTSRATTGRARGRAARAHATTGRGRSVSSKKKK